MTVTSRTENLLKRTVLLGKMFLKILLCMAGHRKICLNRLQKKVSKSHLFYLSIKYFYGAYHGPAIILSALQRGTHSISQDSGRKQMVHSNWINRSESNKRNIYEGVSGIQKNVVRDCATLHTNSQQQGAFPPQACPKAQAESTVRGTRTVPPVGGLQTTIATWRGGDKKNKHPDLKFLLPPISQTGQKARGERAQCFHLYEPAPQGPEAGRRRVREGSEEAKRRYSEHS